MKAFIIIYTILGVIIVFSLFPPEAKAQTSAIKRWSGYLANDSRQFFDVATDKNTYMLSWYWRGLSVLSSQDRSLTRTLRKSNTGDFREMLKVFNEFGNVGYASKFSYGILGFSLLTGNEKFQDAAFTSLESQFISRGIVNLLKIVVGRARPTNYEAAHSFHPFSGRDSFPSGHTVTAFALIAPWIFYYPHTYTYALFLLPAGTAFSRIALDAHWTTDVLAGAAIGIVVSYYLTKWHKKESPQTRFSFSVDDTSLRLVFYPSWLQ